MIDKLSDPLSSCCEVYGGLLRKLISSGAFDLVDRFLSIGLDYESISIETSKFGLDNWKTLQKNFPKNSKLADLSNSEIAKCTSWIERFNENYSTPQTIPPVNVTPPESELEALDISVLLSLSLMISNQKGKLKDSILSIALKKDYNKTIEHAIEHLDINAAESFERLDRYGNFDSTPAPKSSNHTSVLQKTSDLIHVKHLIIKEFQRFQTPDASSEFIPVLTNVSTSKHATFIPDLLLSVDFGELTLFDLSAATKSIPTLSKTLANKGIEKLLDKTQLFVLSDSSSFSLPPSALDLANYLDHYLSTDFEGRDFAATQLMEALSKKGTIKQMKHCLEFILKSTCLDETKKNCAYIFLKSALNNKNFGLIKDLNLTHAPTEIKSAAEEATEFGLIRRFFKPRAAETHRIETMTKFENKIKR